MAEDHQEQATQDTAVVQPTDAAAPQPRVVIEDHAPEVVEIEHSYLEEPQELVLTVKARRFLLFAAKDVKVTVLQGDKELESVQTDGNGQALFRLAKGDYTVRCGERSRTITLTQHATVRF